MANRLLWSVSATAGIPAAATDAINSGTRTIPSTREYSVCNRKWTNCLTVKVPRRAARAQRSGDATDRVHAAPEAADALGWHSPCELRKSMQDKVYPYDSYNHHGPSSPESRPR